MSPARTYLIIVSIIALALGIAVLLDGFTTLFWAIALGALFFAVLAVFDDNP